VLLECVLCASDPSAPLMESDESMEPLIYRIVNNYGYIYCVEYSVVHSNVFFFF